MTLLVGWMSHCSVQTTAQPPSAFTPRITAIERRPGAAHAVAVRHLVEAVARRHRADAHGLEQDVVDGIARHLDDLSPG